MLSFAVAVASAFAIAPAQADDRARAVYSVAQCIVQTNRPAAALLLMSLPTGGDPAHSSAMRTAAEAGCGAHGLLPEDALQLRGGLAQALLLTDFEQLGVEPRNPRALMDLGLPAESDPPVDADRDLYRWSDCVVRNDLENVQRLVRTPVGSRQERQVLDTMQPYMVACAGSITRLVVDASELRGLFAQSAYQALYRYWLGHLREASAASDDPSAQVVCRVAPETASRVRHRRVCLSRADWRKVENMYRDDITDLQRRSTAGAGR